MLTETQRTGIASSVTHDLYHETMSDRCLMRTLEATTSWFHGLVVSLRKGLTMESTDDGLRQRGIKIKAQISLDQPVTDTMEEPLL